MRTLFQKPLCFPTGKLGLASLTRAFLCLGVAVGLGLSARVSGQVQEAWMARYNGHGSDGDSVATMTADSAGNIYVTGGSSGDYATVKYSPSGSQLWAARYSSSGNDDDHAQRTW